LVAVPKLKTPPKAGAAGAGADALKAAADVGAGVGGMGAVVGGSAALSLALFLLKE
jgi:hypothetical protein